MTRLIRLARTRLALGAAVALSLLAARSASAQVMCNDASLLNPIIVSGSTAFEPTLKQFAVKLTAESTPMTIVFATGSNASGSCTGVSTIVNGTDLGGTAGRYYTLSGTTITNNACTFATGQKADVAISDVFYESCMNVGQPRPATIGDVAGPVQAMVFVVPKANSTTQYLTQKEAQTLYGCGAGGAVATFTEAAGIFCRDPNSGTQITVAKNIGLSESVLVAPICVPSSGTGAVVTNVSGFATPNASIGFIAADAFDSNRGTLNSLAFASQGQTQAFYSDSGPAVADRRNVRDGHYTIWGYEHLISQLTNGNPAQKVADFIGYVNGTKTSANFDAANLVGAAGAIPQCAMKVKRSADGGLLSPYAPADACGCAFEAAITKTTPSGCTACTGTGTSTCTGGLSCNHGFCE